MQGPAVRDPRRPHPSGRRRSATKSCANGECGEVPHADRQVAHRPGVVERHRRDRHGAGGPARGRLGHDAEADPALDQAADRIEAAQLHPQPQGLAAAAGLGGEEAGERARPVEPDEIVAEHLGEGHGGPRGQRMALGHHQHEAVAAERVGLEAAGLDRAGDEAEIRRALGDEADDLVGEPLLDVDAHPRMPGEVGRQHLGQELGQRVGVRQDPDLARRPAREGGEVALQPLDVAEDLAGMGQQRAPGRVGVTPRRARTRREAPSEASMLRMRWLAAASARFARFAPWVIDPASTTWRNRLRSTRSKCMAAPPRGIRRPPVPTDRFAGHEGRAPGPHDDQRPFQPSRLAKAGSTRTALRTGRIPERQVAACVTRVDRRPRCARAAEPIGDPV